MAKDKSDLSKEERKAAKALKKAEKSSGGTTLADSGVNGTSKHKSDKKDKKDKKKKNEALAELALEQSEDVNVVVAKDKKSSKKASKKDATEVESDDDDDVEEESKTTFKKPIGALVPFAVPLADEKVAKKVFKGVKKAAAQRTLKRGVKEVVKALRKSPTTLPPNTTSQQPTAIVILAADISPMDVISHIPVLCEDHNIPYIFVQSRAELGISGGTKRPTSVVMVARDVGQKKGKDGKKVDADGEQGEWEEVYAGLAKVVLREGAGVKR